METEVLLSNVKNATISYNKVECTNDPSLSDFLKMYHSYPTPVAVLIY